MEAGEDYSSLAPREMRWLRVGHAHVGQRIARSFGGHLVLGTITRWRPADVWEGDAALFRAEHDDGEQPRTQRASHDRAQFFSSGVCIS